MAFESPEIGFSPKSTLMVLEAPFTQDRVWAWPGGIENMPLVTAKAEGTLSLLYYEQSLDALGLSEGRLELAGIDEEGRPLPQPRAGFRGPRGQNEFGPWSEILSSDDIFRRVRLNWLFPGQSCWEVGGCYATLADVDNRSCNLDCIERRMVKSVQGPAAPAAIDFTPCSPGWGPVSEFGMTYCDPPRLQRCEPGFAMWPSLTACIRIGSACPEPNMWPAGLPTDRPILYVRPGALGGDGSAGAPYSGLQQTIDVAPADAVIVLAPGTYEDPVFRSTGATLWGACVEGTLIRTSAPLRLSQGRSGLVNLSVVGPDGSVVISGGQIVLHDLDISGHWLGEAMIVNSSSVSMQGVRIRGSVDSPSAALNIGAGAIVHGSQLVFDNNGQYSLNVHGAGTQLTIRDAWLTAGDRVHRSDGGAYVQGGAELKLNSVVVEGFRAEGLTVADEDSQLEMLQVVLRDITSPSGAVGVRVIGARADLSRVRIERVQGPGLQMLGGRAQGERLIISEADSAEQGHISVEGGEIELGVSLLRDSKMWGIRLSEAKATLRDLRIEQVGLGTSVGIEKTRLGVGLLVLAGTEFVGRRISIRGTATHGLVMLARDDEAWVSAEVQDLKISEVAQMLPKSGHGLEIKTEVRGEGGDTTFARVEIVSVAGAGLYLREKARAEVRDILVEDSSYGIRTVRESSLTLQRAYIRRARLGGICIRNFSHLRAEDLIIIDTIGDRSGSLASQWVCANAQPGQGDGIRVGSDVRVSLSGYEVRGSFGSGLVSALPETLSAQGGLITGNRVGLSIPQNADLGGVLLTTQIYGNQTDLLIGGAPSP